MPRKKNQNHAILIAKAPEGTVRFYVRTELDVLKYKTIAELADTDEIQVKADGIPIVMKGKPGRKRKVVVAPANDTVGAILKKREGSLSSDGVLQATLNDGPEEAVMHAIIKALAEEQASLAFVRQELERQGKLEETASITSRRVQGLKTMADTLQRRIDGQRARNLETESPSFQAYYQHVMGTFKEAMASVGCRPEMIETVFSKFAAMTSDPTWESEAKARVRQAV